MLNWAIIGSGDVVERLVQDSFKRLKEINKNVGTTNNNAWYRNQL